MAIKDKVYPSCSGYLSKVFNGINVMVWRRTNKTNSRNRFAGFGNLLGDLKDIGR